MRYILTLKGIIKMEKILEKAKELGIMISKSKEFEALKEAEAAHMADKEAVQIMMDYSNKQQDIQKRASVPDITKEEMTKLKEEAQAEFAKICENQNIKAYLDASQAFARMIEQVNSIIGYFVKGGDASGCSGNCSGCSGCH